MTNYLIAGSEPGESKVAKAKDKRVEIIDEAKLFEMIRTLPGKDAPKAKAPSKRTKKGGGDSLNAIAAARGKSKQNQGGSKPNGPTAL